MASNEVIFEELGSEERKLLLRAFDYDVDEEDYILDSSGKKIRSVESPESWLRIGDSALVPGSLKVIDGTPTSISRYLREQIGRAENDTGH